MESQTCGQERIMIHGSWPAQVVGPHVMERFCLALVAFRPKAAIPGDQKSPSLRLDLEEGRAVDQIKKGDGNHGACEGSYEARARKKVRGQHGTGLLGGGAGKVGGPAVDCVSSERVSSCA